MQDSPKIDTRRIMVQALNQANSEAAVRRKVKTALLRILTDFSKADHVGSMGESGTDAILGLLFESLYTFTSSRTEHNLSYLTSFITNLLESEVAWARITNQLTNKERKYVEGFFTAVNRSTAKNFKDDPYTRYNVIQIMTNLKPKHMTSANPLRKIITSKAWSKLAVGVANDVSSIKAIIFRTLDIFTEMHPDYEMTIGKYGSAKMHKIHNVGKEVKNYMFKEALDLTQVIHPNFPLLGSVHTKSVEISLKSAYTFNEDFNDAIQAIIAAGVHTKYFTAENDKALMAKVTAVENDVEQGLAFWNEVGKGTVYFNYVVDFRGRISQLGGLSAVGHKTGRSMLRAAEGKALGEHGYKHMLIALASSMGHDKLTFTDRIEWANDNLADYITIGSKIIDNPVEAFEDLYDRDADDIFEAAAICFELFNISQSDCLVEHYKSNLFIGYDATCSGLQIVSLLWGNKMLAENTNVAKFENTEDKIYDIYKYLWKAMDVVAKNFNPVTPTTPDGEDLMDVWHELDDKTKREIAKKLLMPRIYGSTFRTWTKNTVKLAGKKNLFAHITDETERNATTFQFGLVIANLFKATFDNEDGFQAFRDFDNVVHQVATAYNKCGRDTVWTINEPSTVDNQLIRARYRELITSRYYVYRNGQKTRATSYTVSIFEKELQKVSKTNKVKLNPVKAKNAISPNFVHSLDALLLHTVNRTMGTTMKLTHDCFGCCAGEVEWMMDVINNSYISLFGGDNNLIQKLADETEANTKVEIIIPETLKSEGINTDCIKKGHYKFS